MKSRYLIFFITFFLFLASVIPANASAQEKTMEFSAWIPYWRYKEGIQSILPNLQNFTEVNPFIYTVRRDGSLFQASALTEPEWLLLRAKAREINVRFIPTVMWSNPDAIDDVLKSPEKRQKHIQAIAFEVFRNDLDGIDIDYEAKYARTRPYFSLFLKELNEAIGYDRWVMCTIESRTPLDSRFSSPATIPSDIEYANDFSEINRYCDRVRIMAYDQGRIDLKLNEERGHPYVPVADLAWVEKVSRLAMEEIAKEKILIGVPTYGYEYDMFLSLSGSGRTEYSRLWSFNPSYALSHAKTLNLTPKRDSAGELSLVYPAKDSPDEVIPLDFATRVMSWSDAESIRQKIGLANQLGTLGISIFKIDGGQDPALWNVLKDFNPVKDGKKPIKISEEVNLKLNAPTGRDLVMNMTGEDVKQLQTLLNTLGFKVSSQGAGSPGNETNFFGPATRDALIRFQKKHNVTPAAGYYGPKTQLLMQSLAN
jgi:spore germination protein YaaH